MSNSHSFPAPLQRSILTLTVAILLLVTLTPTASAAATYPHDDTDSYVIDDADILTAVEEAELHAICESLDIQHSTLMVVIVITGLEDYDGVEGSNSSNTELTMPTYTGMLYERFVEPYEDETYRDGILLVLSVGATNVSTGNNSSNATTEWQYGYEFGVGWTDTGAFDQAQAVATDRIEPLFDEGEWHQALRTFSSHLSKSADDHISGDAGNGDVELTFSEMILTGIFCFVAIVAVVVMVYRGATGRLNAPSVSTHVVHDSRGMGYFRDPHESIHIHHHHGTEHHHHSGGSHGRSDSSTSHSASARRVGGGGRSGGGRRTGGSGRSGGGGSSSGGGRSGGGRRRGR